MKQEHQHPEKQQTEGTSTPYHPSALTKFIVLANLLVSQTICQKNLWITLSAQFRKALANPTEDEVCLSALNLLALPSF